MEKHFFSVESRMLDTPPRIFISPRRIYFLRPRVAFFCGHLQNPFNLSVFQFVFTAVNLLLNFIIYYYIIYNKIIVNKLAYILIERLKV